MARIAKEGFIQAENTTNSMIFESVYFGCIKLDAIIDAFLNYKGYPANLFALLWKNGDLQRLFRK